MANANTPFGLKPVRRADSGHESGGVNMYYHPATDATALYIGDLVIKNGSADAAGIPGAIRATAAGACTGVVVGFVPDGVVDVAGYGAASTAYYVLVCDAPGELFIAQEDGVGGQLAAADVGLNVDFINAAGSAYTKRSGAMIDSSTKATTATLPLKIVGLAPIPGNDFGAYAKFLVKINNHTEASASAGV